MQIARCVPDLPSLLALSVFLAALPRGLNAPFLWLNWGLVIAVFAWVKFREPGALKLSPILQSLFWLSLIIPAFALLQVLTMPQAVMSFVRLPVEADISPSRISLLPSASMVASLRWFLYIVFFALVISAMKTRETALRFLWMLYWGIVVHGICALLIHTYTLNGEGFSEIKLSLTGGFVGRNAFATYLGIGLCLGLVLMLQKSNRLNQRCFGYPRHYFEILIVLLGLIIILTALVKTQSRLGLTISLFSAGLTVALLRKNAIFWFIPPLGIMTLLAGLIAMEANVTERLVFIQSGFEIRFEAYSQTFELIATRPWTGFGFDCFRLAFELVHSAPLTGAFIWDRAHSTYLTHWVELGLIVGSVPILLGAIVFKELISALSKQNTPTRTLSVAALSTLILGALHSSLDFSLEIPANTFLLLAIVGAALRYHKGAQERQ